MKVVPCVLTFDQFRTNRAQDFQGVIAAIRAAGVEPWVCTNGSSDGTDKVVAALPKGLVFTEPKAMWFGMTAAILAAIDEGAEVVAFFADDVRPVDGWLPKLQAFWRDAPDDVAIAGMFLEDSWPWNEPTGTIDAGGVHGVIRDSVPSASWTFRARDWPVIRHESGTIHPQSPGEDLETCKRLTAQGYRLVQLDLAEHTAIERSAWGNASHLTAKPFDRKRWGFE